MKPAEDIVLAKSFARERMRIWAPVLRKYKTLGDLLRGANRRYSAENNELELVAKTPPTQERYAQICTLLKNAYARACAENDPTIGYSDFADRAFCLLGESPKGSIVENPEDLLFTKDEVDAYNSILTPTLAVLNLWLRHVVYLDLPTERKSGPAVTFRATDFVDRMLWNRNCYSLMRVFYASRKALESLFSRLDFLIPIFGEKELRQEFESRELVEFLNEKAIERVAQVNAEFIRLACSNPSADLEDAAIDNLLKQLPQLDIARSPELRRAMNVVKVAIEQVRAGLSAGESLSDQDLAGYQQAQDIIAKFNELFALPEELPVSDDGGRRSSNKGVCEFKGTEVHPRINIDPGSSVKVGAKLYKFTAAKSWEIFNRFFRAIKDGTLQMPDSEKDYPIPFTSADYNQLKDDARALFLDFCERQPVATKERSKKFEPYARFRMELLK